MTLFPAIFFFPTYDGSSPQKREKNVNSLYSHDLTRRKQTTAKSLLSLSHRTTKTPECGSPRHGRVSRRDLVKQKSFKPVDSYAKAGPDRARLMAPDISIAVIICSTSSTPGMTRGPMSARMELGQSTPSPLTDGCHAFASATPSAWDPVPSPFFSMRF